MARKPPEPPSEREWTPESIRASLRKIRRRLADVEAFDPQKITRQFDPLVTGLETSIRETLAEVFGPNSRSYRNYQLATALDTAGFNSNGTPLHRVIEGLVHGKERSITLLKGAIQFFEEKMEDDFPGEPLDQVALSARTAIMATGGAGAAANAGSLASSVEASLSGAEVRAQAGEAQDIAAFTGVVENDEFRFIQLQARVALLESSLNVLRHELASPAAERKIGPGHNQGPDFLPVPVEQLDDVDRLIALLKDRGHAPPADPTPLIEQNEKVALLSGRINAGLIALGTEMTKGAAREAGKEILASHWASVSHWIASVGHAMLVWLGLA
jgi:hypothetical protein